MLLYLIWSLSPDPGLFSMVGVKHLNLLKTTNLQTKVKTNLLLFCCGGGAEGGGGSPASLTLS